MAFSLQTSHPDPQHTRLKIDWTFNRKLAHWILRVAIILVLVGALVYSGIVDKSIILETVIGLITSKP